MLKTTSVTALTAAGIGAASNGASAQLLGGGGLFGSGGFF